ncbi:MAG: DUF4143 domain-containing protein [Eubacteriales bacterium]|nr:DUF4143 domain-containing protein [Eubacteriales bacterium]MDD3350032.1 DUF4143 domain-containing protein [Eubacteriales bacterium]
MKRKIMDDLMDWKEKGAGSGTNRLPLLIYGARQVGKTYAMREFGRSCYKNQIYINFERMETIAAYFDGDISPKTLIPVLEAVGGSKIIPGETLIIFDEIQSCERALTSLKYFAEEAPEQHVIAAGSLLGVALNRGKYSFPVGKVKILNMYPLDMEEYLWAQGEELLTKEIRNCYENNHPMPTLLHEDLLNKYTHYLITGGMPAVVKDYIENRSVNSSTELQEDVLNSYIADMTKYTTSGENMRIKSSYDSMPAQLAKENKKFQYKLIRKGATANLFGEAIEWLITAGIVLKCSKVNSGLAPLEVQKDLSSFKLYMSDVGLYRAKAKLLPEEILLGNFDSSFKGAMAENYVAQSLVANKHTIYYWESNSQAEVDFVIRDRSGKVIPVEVKYNDNVRSKSLSVFCKRYESEYAIRVSAKNFGFENDIKSVPLYATYCI